MKKILKKRVLIIIFMAIAIWGMNANKEVKAVEATTDTPFGSISTNNPSFADDSEKRLDFKISFAEKFLDSIVKDYAGIKLSISTSDVNWSEFKDYSYNGWNMTARTTRDGGSTYNYIFEKTNDIATGDKTVDFVISFYKYNRTPNITFTIKDVQVSSSTGKSKKCEEEYSVTSNVEIAPKLQSSDKNVKVNDNGFDLCEIKVRTGGTNITTWKSLKDVLTDISQYTEVEIKNMVGTSRQETNDACTGKLILTYNGKKRTVKVYVIGDCWQTAGSGDPTKEKNSEKIDINDVFLQRYKAVGFEWYAAQSYVDDGTGIAERSSADVNDPEDGEVDITDIILTRRRIVDNKWLVDE